MAVVGVIGGTGADLFPTEGASLQGVQTTRWGAPSAPLLHWQQSGHDIVFLARHGVEGKIPPHCVNYRANLAALAGAGADFVIALNAVGGIAAEAVPGRLVIPDQLVDYTWGREHSIYTGEEPELEFVDFSLPYDQGLREGLLAAACTAELDVLSAGTYGATQGPRLESAAEIDRLERDGCDLVGMTGMPEAGLARELQLRYASCCLVVNAAPGRGNADIHAEIGTYLEQGMSLAARLLAAWLNQL